MAQNFSASYCQFQPYIKHTCPVISFPNLQDGGSSQKPGYRSSSIFPSPNLYILPVIFPNTTNKHNLKAAIPLHFLLYHYSSHQDPSHLLMGAYEGIIHSTFPFLLDTAIHSGNLNCHCELEMSQYFSITLTVRFEQIGRAHV